MTNWPLLLSHRKYVLFHAHLKHITVPAACVNLPNTSLANFDIYCRIGIARTFAAGIHCIVTSNAEAFFQSSVYSLNKIPL